MKRSLIAAVVVALPFRLAGQPADADVAGGWASVDRVFSRLGKDLPGDVHRLSWLRTDLDVRLAGVAVEPALALGSWGAFQRTGKGEAAVMGDLVLLGREVNDVVRHLQNGQFEILAIHNHLIDESPRVMYVHFHGRGDAVSLAKTLKGALEKTGTPLAASADAPSLDLSVAEEKAFQKIQEVLGRKGSMAGRVLQIGVPRAENVQDAGKDVPASMGLANAMNFQAVGARVATTGDFVLIADEVNPVARELQAHGLLVTALHSHMLRESPRLFFMHFWGMDEPAKIAGGLKAALAHVATR